MEIAKLTRSGNQFGQSYLLLFSSTDLLPQSEVAKSLSRTFETSGLPYSPTLATVAAIFHGFEFQLVTFQTQTLDIEEGPVSDFTVIQLRFVHLKETCQKFIVVKSDIELLPHNANEANVLLGVVSEEDIREFWQQKGFCGQ